MYLNTGVNISKFIFEINVLIIFSGIYAAFDYFVQCTLSLKYIVYVGLCDIRLLQRQCN